MCRCAAVRYTGDYFLPIEITSAIPWTNLQNVLAENQTRKSPCTVRISHCWVVHNARCGWSWLERTVPYCGMKIILYDLFFFPSPCHNKSSPLRADQSSVVSPGQAALLLPLLLICHWPDLKLLDHCLKSLKTLWQEVIHWIRKPVGRISWCWSKSEH